MKRLFLSFFKFLFLVFIALGILFWQYHQWSQYQSKANVELEITSGTSLRKISQLLADHELIANPWFFEAYIRLTNQALDLKAGHYSFKEQTSFFELVEKLKKGQDKLFSITIPEGYRVDEIKNILIDKKITSFDQWNQTIQDKDFIKSLNLPSDSLEGYLFPDTYFVSKKTDLKQMIRNMVGHFFNKITEDKINQAKEKGFTLHQWVSLASIIEKETGASFERPMIASVFLNRLKMGMKLQTDPTVIYGIKNFDGNLTRTHLLTDHAYNTYTRTGLPPGPICSPGYEAMMSVLSPSQDKNLYFVAKGDGTHYFSKTLAEHNKAVRYYQLKRGTKP